MDEHRKYPPERTLFSQWIAFFLGKSPFWIGLLIGILGMIIYAAFIRM